MPSNRHVKEMVDKHLLSVPEAAEIIDCNPSNIYFWIENKKLTLVTRGNLQMVYRDECLKLKEERANA